MSAPSIFDDIGDDDARSDRSQFDIYTHYTHTPRNLISPQLCPLSFARFIWWCTTTRLSVVVSSLNEFRIGLRNVEEKNKRKSETIIFN